MLAATQANVVILLYITMTKDYFGLIHKPDSKRFYDKTSFTSSHIWTSLLIDKRLEPIIHYTLLTYRQTMLIRKTTIQI